MGCGYVANQRTLWRMPLKPGGKDRMTTLYGVYRSRASRNLWLLGELGMPFRHVPVIQAYRLADPQAADAPLNTQSAAFLKLSPFGAIPVLEDDGLVLTESLAINLYLAEKAGGPLAPASARERAEVVESALFAATSIEADALALLLAHQDGTARSAEGHAKCDALASRLRRPLAALDRHLAARGHPVGGRFTVADINLAEVLRYAQGQPGLIEEFPAINRWLQACQARPAFRTMWEARSAEPA